MNERRCNERKSDRGFFNRYRTCMEAVLITFTALGIIYATVLEPHLNNIIDNRQIEIKESIEYMKCSFQAIMSDDQRKRAELFYRENRHNRGKVVEK